MSGDEQTLTDEQIETKRREKLAKGVGAKGDVPKEKPDYADRGASGADNDLIIDADPRS